MKQVLAAVALVVALAGCGAEEPIADVPIADAPTARPTAAADDDGEGGGACDEAFAGAATASATQDTQEKLHPAFTVCADFEEWQETSERHPDTLDGVDPETYARNQCQYVPELAGTPVCESLPAG